MKQYVKTYRYSSNLTILPFFKHDFRMFNKTILSRMTLEKYATVPEWMESIEVE